MNFGFGNSALRKSEIKKLDALAGVIKSRGFKTITIYGHTDSIGPDSVSDWLSKSRAIAVQKYLSFKLKGTSVKFRVDSQGELELPPITLTQGQSSIQIRVTVAGVTRTITVRA